MREESWGAGQCLTEQVLQRYTPAAVLIDDRCAILETHGPTKRFLEYSTDPVGCDLTRLVMPGVRGNLRAAMARSLREAQLVVVNDARIRRRGSYLPVRLTVEPVRGVDSFRSLLLITFAQRGSGAIPKSSTDADEAHWTERPGGLPDNPPAVIRGLRRELEATQDDLARTIQQLEQRNEDLRAANEEMVLINEELQSANEELEASMQELVWLNDDATAVNKRLESHLQELAAANDLIINLVRSTHFAAVFLDRNLCIRMFTPPAEKLFRFRSSDVGRPLSDIAPKYSDHYLLEDCQRVLDQLAPVEREVWTRGAALATRPECTRSEYDSSGLESRCYIRRILPFRTAENRIDGVVLSFTDITDQKRVELVTLEAKTYAEGIIESLHEPLVVLDAALRVQSANAAFLRFFQVSWQEAENRPLYEFGDRSWEHPELRGLLTAVLNDDAQITDYRIEHECANLERRAVLLNARRIRRLDSHPDELLLVFNDLTEHERGQRELRDHELRLRAIFDHTLEFIGLLSPDGTLLKANRASLECVGATESEVVGQPYWLTPWWTHDHALQRRLQKAIHRCAQGAVDRFDATHRFADGRIISVEFSINPVKNEAGTVVLLVPESRDVTDRKQAEQVVRKINEELEERVLARTTELQASEDRLRAILNAAVDSIISIDRRGEIVGVNKMTEQMFGYGEHELWRKNVELLIPSPYREQDNDDLASCLSTRRSHLIGISREVTAKRKDGSTFPAELAVSEVEGLNLFTGIIRDVSKRKDLERQVVNAAAEEQRRIGQDIHDGLGQELTGLRYMAQTHAESLRAQGSAEARTAERMNEWLESVQKQLRAIIRALVPVELDQHGLVAALRGLADRTAEVRGLDCSFECNQSVIVPDAVLGTHLYRIAQEAVRNAVYHAQASRIVIQLTANEDGLRMLIADDGVGIDPRRAGNHGIGLRSMQYRASLIGASMDIRPGLEGGTQVTCMLRRGASGAPCNQEPSTQLGRASDYRSGLPDPEDGPA